MTVVDGLHRALAIPSRFSETFLPGYQMRRYQADVADGIAAALTFDPLGRGGRLCPPVASGRGGPLCPPAGDQRRSPLPDGGSLYLPAGDQIPDGEPEPVLSGAEGSSPAGDQRRSPLPGGGINSEVRLAREFAAVFSRQAGKDEMLAQLCAWLLVRNSRVGGQIVVALPALDPQGIIARDRLLSRLRSPRLQAIGVLPRVREGRIVQVGRASVHYVSASPMANARGLTASLLLVGNEAQDIDPERWDAVFAPMAASTDAPTLFMGTVWTSDTLLSRQLTYFRDLEQQDGVRRRYLVPWRDVAAELPAYGTYVERQIAQLGSDHPFIRSEYELIELDGDGGLFPTSRQGQMQGDHPPLIRAQPGETYALLLDVAGEEEEPTHRPGKAYQPDAKRDSTALTVVRVVRRSGSKPRYEVVRRYLWTGIRHTELHGQLVDLTKNVWKAAYLVVDATGIGAGLTSFLREALGERVVIPFIFSQSSKSKLGWDFLGIVDSGRFKEYDARQVPPSPRIGRGDGGEGDDPESDDLSNIFWRQVRACRYQVRSGPNRLLSWEVPDARTHDDLLISAALVGVLDEQDWRPRTARGRGYTD